jgi:protein-disulfide isomerase
MEEETAPLPEGRKAARLHLPIAIVLAVFVFAIGGGALLLELRMRPARSTTATGLPGAQPPHARGSERARVHVEQFEDFQCANCAALEPAFRKIERDYGTKLRITFREFPLPNHEHAMAAAQAAEAAGLQNHFWQMHDLLFQNAWIWRKAPNPQLVFEQFAKNIGLDVERYKKDIASDVVKARIVADQERATSLGVIETPAFIINQQRVPNSSLTDEGLRAAIETALKPKSR